MLMQVRPLPVGEPLTLPVLPGVTIHASRAGHIAGAVSLGFVASNGSLVVSGDISSTPQRTVLGAVPPPIAHPDLLVLESTYGARLHPNRQAEEQRLAQAVAEGIANGGHTLIPCFGLGRGQELLLLLQAAQEKGQVPDFPIYVDGLVRRVCSTYLLLPEALPPRLQRQIRKGFLPFSGPNVTFVHDERDRERILAGPPACIVTSSGMLTGGPSVWYASRIASDPNASILITGYQDEESPGKRLLDLAENKKNTLELLGQQLQVQCHVAKYSLSAHADGGELAAYAAALKPRRVALVHGDDQARAALRTLLGGTAVLLPTNGMAISAVEQQEQPRSRSSRAVPSEPAKVLDTLPVAIGAGTPFDYRHVERLWHAVTQVPTLRIVTARELALIWYGEATEETTESILDTFAQDYEQRYFIRQNALEEAYRVRGQQEEIPGDFLSDMVGSVLLLLISLESAKPVLCRAIEPGAAVRVQLPRGISQERTRFPFSSIFEILGPAPQEVQQSNSSASIYLNNLVKVTRRIRRSLSASDLARQCQAEATYTLGDLCLLAGLAPQSLEERLAVAKLLHQHPRLFTQCSSVFDGEGQTLYALSPEWREAIEEPQEHERPDQAWILSVIEQYLGSPPDLYRRSIDPDTGAVVLAFHFPAVASIHYAEAIAAAAEEIGVPITIAPQAHQGALANAARHHVPQGLVVHGTPSLYFERSVIALTCQGQTTAAELAEAQSAFYTQTGWHLEIEGATVSREEVFQSIQALSERADMAATFQPIQPVHSTFLNQHDALQIAQHLLQGLAGYQKVGLDIATSTLLLRFQFPNAAQTRYAEVFAQLEAETGWSVRLQPTTNQQALIEMACNLLPSGLTCNGMPSLYLDQQIVGVQCVGNASSEAIEEATQQFHAETGWQLKLVLPGQKAAIPGRVPQGQAVAMASEIFSMVPDFYRVGADASKGNLWLHFHFPDIARQRYMEQLSALATQTGWRVYLHPSIHQKALIEVARHLLPAGVGISGRASVYQDRRTLSLTCTALVNAEAKEAIQRQFIEETGWHLELYIPA
ncbi:MAG: hypothetical protein NVSMB33_07720 [Ktedonobacteraceae bacterium]